MKPKAQRIQAHNVSAELKACVRREAAATNSSESELANEALGVWFGLPEDLRADLMRQARLADSSVADVLNQQLQAARPSCQSCAMRQPVKPQKRGWLERFGTWLAGLGRDKWCLA